MQVSAFKQLYVTGIVVLGLSIAFSFAQAQQPLQVVEGEYLIKMRSVGISTGRVSQKISNKGSLKGVFKDLGIYHISLKASDEQKSLNDLRLDPEVEYIEPNYILSVPGNSDAERKIVESFSRDEIEAMTVGSTNPTVYSQSGAPTQVQDSWPIETAYSSSNQITVAIVDTGLDDGHKVFTAYNVVAGTNIGGTGALWTNQAEANGVAGVDDDGNGFIDDIHGWNFITNSANYYDDDGHGTHVAGITVGAGLNIFGNPLARSKIKIMPLKFLAAGGSGSTANAIRAIYYAVNMGARVINNSWGGSNYSKSLHEALTYAYASHVLIVTAAGNYSKNNDTTPMYPANYDVPSNISVAATTDSDSLAYFSNYGAGTVHIGSPGMDIQSTIPGNSYGYLSGTSMAAPFIAGMAAMALSESSGMTGYQVKNLLTAQADNDVALSGRTTSSGRVNSLKLIQAAQSMLFTTAYQPDYSPVYSSQDFASTSGGGSKGGCGMVSSAFVSGASGKGMGGPLGVLAGLMLLPLIVWAILRRRATSPQAKRRHDRFKMNSEVRVKVGDRELIGSMNSISMGGLSFNIDEALEKGGVVSMRIASPDGHEAIEVEGQIVWSEQNQSYGVKFSEAHEGVKGMIKHWTRSLMKT